MLDEKTLLKALIVAMFAGLAALGGLLTLPAWREDVRKGLAAFIFGLIAGGASVMAGADGWVPFWTLFGAAAGANLFKWMNTHQVAAAAGEIMMDFLRNLFSGGKGGKDDDSKE